jgi:hypothetical protein
MSKDKKPSGYVLYILERMQDGTEECARCFDTVEAAVAYANKPHWPGGNLTFRLFGLGKEIPLAEGVEEEPQPPKTKTVYRVKKR